mmetsp:Transcript_38615/g.77882  ORF Transcript_38615/g.77882 Transcript_38615/m.77882 type:complete len:407 (+) Transcript_38615:36-1256(+)
MPSDTEEAKARGSEAYKAGRFDDAVREFTAAIDSATGDDTEIIHLLYSNRSAAFQQLKQFDKANEDAEACTLDKPNWAKGFVHLGLCSTKLGKFDEAVTAYKKAIELDPSRAAGIRNSLALAEQGKRQREGASSGSSRSGGGGNLAASVPASVGKLVLWGGMFLNAATLLLSFTGNPQTARQANRSFVMAFFASFVLHFYTTHGLPKLSQEFMVQIMSDRRVQRVLGGLLLLMGPNTLILFSLLLPEFAAMCSCLLNVVLPAVPSVGPRAATALQALLQDKVVDRSGAPFWKVDQWSAFFEVGALVMLLCNLAFPTRNIGQLVLWCQNLQVRFVIETASHQTSGVLHVAFANLEARCDALAAKLPGALGAVYNKLKGLIHNQVALPDPNAPKAGFLSGLTSKCTVM